MQTTEELKITVGESVTVRRSDADQLEVEGAYAPGGAPPPAHFHPAQDEHFTVLEGELRARLDGNEIVLRTGGELSVPRGSVHQMWNPGNEPARVTWRITPPGRTLDWFRAIDALHRQGRVGRNGMPGPLAFGVLLTEYDDIFRLAARPQPLVRAALAALGVLGRLRGYSSQPPQLRSAG